MRLHADELQRHVVATVVDGREHLPPISREVVHGDAIDVLVRASTHADLLVMGSHGVSTLRHAALGSVSEACARLSECPLVVVPVPLAVPHNDELAVV
jgi:nucleotide-binding universal stress UspA family protein